MKNLLLLFLFLPLFTNAQIITTYAGDSIAGYNGDGIPCGISELNNPNGVTIDKAHNVYIGDGLNNRVRRIDTAGIITTIAGTGVSGYSGDNGPATLAKLNFPDYLFVDNTGNIYFADLENNCVRKINTVGIITTIAGDGTPGFFGDNGPATAAELNSPGGIVIDTLGSIYIADEGNNRIRKVDTAGIITTFAGGGTTLGDNGPATAAMLQNPYGITIDSAGNLYIADTDNRRIRKVNTSRIITTVVGNGSGIYNGEGVPATSAGITPADVKLDHYGNIYFSDGATRLRGVDTAGIVFTVAGNAMGGFSGDGGPAIDAAFYDLEQIAIDDSENMYLADAGNNRIRYISKVSLGVSTINGRVIGVTVFPNPSKGVFTLAISSVTQQQVLVVITDLLGEKIKEYTAVTNKPLDINITAPPGIYFISAITAQGTITRKIVIQ